jgi:alcohol dehydrogenase
MEASMSDTGSTAAHKAWSLPAFGQPLRYEARPTPVPHPRGALVRIESAMVHSYMAKVLDGSLGYATPPFPFVPGTNAIGRIAAVGREVFHVTPGDRVFLSPHLIADEPVAEPSQILIGLTAIGAAPSDGAANGSRRLQELWRDGVFSEIAHWPGSCVTPLGGLDAFGADRLIALAKLVVPFGGLLRSGLAGQVALVNGASGYYGSAGVMVALAMGARRVVAIGRDRSALERLAGTLGPRVVPAALGGDMAADMAAIQAAAQGKADVALDLLGQATSTASTLATLRSLKRGGRLVLMGSAKVPLELGFGEMLGNDWEVVGCFMYPRTAPARLAALVAGGQLDLSPVRVRTFPLDRLPEAIAAAAGMRDLDLTAVAPA